MNKFTTILVDSHISLKMRIKIAINIDLKELTSLPRDALTNASRGAVFFAAE